MILQALDSRLGASAGLAALLIGLACGEPTAPLPEGPVAVLHVGGIPTVDHARRVALVDLTRPRIHRWSPEVMYRPTTARLSRDGARLFVIGAGEAGWKSYQIAVLDARTLDIERREFFADSAGYRLERFDGIEIGVCNGFRVSLDDTRLFIHGCRRAADGAWGVAVLNLATLEVDGFIGPLPDRDYPIEVVPRGAFSGGALAVGIANAEWPNHTSTIRFLDQTTLTVIDSVDLSSQMGGDGIFAMVAAPDGRSLYLWTFGGWLHRLDLSALRIEASVFEPSGAGSFRLTLDRSGERVFFTHGATQDFPSPGTITVYDRDLNEVTTIDLSEHGVDGVPPPLNFTVEGPDDSIVVGSGGGWWSLWGTHDGRLFILDGSTYEVETVIELGAVGAKQIFFPGM